MEFGVSASSLQWIDGEKHHLNRDCSPCFQIKPKTTSFSALRRRNPAFTSGKPPLHASIFNTHIPQTTKEAAMLGEGRKEGTQAEYAPTSKIPDEKNRGQRSELFAFSLKITHWNIVFLDFDLEVETGEAERGIGGGGPASFEKRL
ncbi:hypothetical protein ACLOJK_008994 [Asimina triloba]